MLTIIALIVSILLQFVAMVFAISLIRSTKYNSSWILISSGLMIMAIRRLFDFLPYVDHQLSQQITTFNSWLGVLVSLLMVIGVFYIRKIFAHLKKMDEIRLAAEKRVLNAIIQTEEKERKRLAGDLHDGLGPMFSTVKMSVSSLVEHINEGKQKAVFDNALMAINESINSLREISNNLSPHILENFGLQRAIRTFAGKIEETGKIKIDFTSNLKEQRFDGTVEVIIYRAVCELIVNTIKHAEARKILISLHLEAGKLMLLYQDDGKGFDFRQVLEGKIQGMGLNNIRSRVLSLNGNFNVDSFPGEGIIVTIDVNV